MFSEKLLSNILKRQWPSHALHKTASFYNHHLEGRVRPETFRAAQVRPYPRSQKMKKLLHPEDLDVTRHRYNILSTGLKEFSL